MDKRKHGHKSETSDSDDSQLANFGASGDQIVQTALNAEEEKFARRLVTFSLPESATPEENDIAKDFVRLDHRSIRTLGPYSNERGEVRDLLINVATMLQEHQAGAARALLDHAEAVYYQHIQARNRLRYLGGMLCGIGLIFGFGMLLINIPSELSSVMPRSHLPVVLLFSGMGTVTSVLTRLSSIDLREQTSIWMVYVSGMARPVTGAFLTLVIYLLVDLKVVDLHIGVSSDGARLETFLVAAFMAGFSERFAQDVLARLGGEGNPLKTDPRNANETSGEVHRPSVKGKR
jgi:hypothetical protein